MRIIYTLFAISLVGMLVMGSSSGPGNVQGQDRTGGPLANGFCGNCHATGAFNPEINVEVREDGVAVQSYEAGVTYQLRVSIAADAGAQVYGFQAVALTGADNDQAGSFTAGAGTQVISLGGRDYIEHSERSNSSTFEVDWTAPNSGLGDIRFYAAGVAANNAAGSGGDGAVFLNDPVILQDMSVSTNDIPELAAALKVFPNPVQEQLNVQLDLDNGTLANFRLVNATGQTLLQQQQELAEGRNNTSFNVADLPAGQYWLEVTDGERASRTAVMKY